MPIVGVLLSEIFKCQNLHIEKRVLPTGRLIVGRDAPAQGTQSKFFNCSGGQSGRPDVGLCLRLLGATIQQLKVLDSRGLAVRSTIIAYLSWKIEIGRDWYRSQIERRLRGKSENVYSGTRTFCLFDRGKS